MKVLNFGSCNIDYVYQMEHFIRPGETAPCTALSAGCGGKGLNQSIALAKAGTEVYHAGLYGAEGKFLLDKMQEAGVDTSLMRLGEGANGHAIIQVERSGQNCIILYGGNQTGYHPQGQQAQKHAAMLFQPGFGHLQVYWFGHVVSCGVGAFS